MCPMCGSPVSATASECPHCGEKFAPPEEEYFEETITEEQEEIEYLPGDEEQEPGMQPEEQPEAEYEDTGEMLPEEYPEAEYEDAGEMQPEEYPETGEPAESSEGCPICGSRSYNVEAGDLVSCTECGNVYIRKEFEGAVQNWKWKFWVGLIFIVIGDLGVALGSYVHNVLQWSPLGNMYLGYGWMDQLTGIIGIVLFILGLILFAWSFKREREVQCPSCKVIVLESQLEPVEEEEEEEELPEELAVESALEEIGEVAECPNCGAEVSMFDESCPNCGTIFEVDVGNGEYLEEPETIEGTEPAVQQPEGEYLPASEIDEEAIIMESLELEEPEEPQPNGNGGLRALEELESSIDLAAMQDTESTCPNCGAIIGAGLDTCPGCGARIEPEGGE